MSDVTYMGRGEPHPQGMGLTHTHPPNRGSADPAIRHRGCPDIGQSIRGIIKEYIILMPSIRAQINYGVIYWPEESDVRSYHSPYYVKFGDSLKPFKYYVYR